MKTSLTDKIKENKELFDTAVPSYGHVERFEKKLQKYETRKNRQGRRWIIATSLAAMLALVLLFRYVQPFAIRTTLPPDPLVEASNFYHMQLQEEIEKIKAELKKSKPDEAEKVLEDIYTMVKEREEIEKKNLKMPEEEKIALLVFQYNVQLESLRHIQAVLHSTPAREERN